MQRPLVVHEHFAPNNDGWLLHCRQTFSAEDLDLDRPPVVIVPGYGMNSFIFGFHPAGRSMERVFAEAGHEVWSVNLRSQGDSRPAAGRAAGPSMRAWADVDLAAAIDTILAERRVKPDRVTLVGCSLGGSISYAHIALRAEHRVGALVSIGAPLRWITVHPLLRAVFASPRLVGAVRVRGTRRLARTVLPALSRIPGLLDIYLNADHVDMSVATELTQTIEDPHPRINRDIARWMNHGDLVLRGVNVTRALARTEQPLLLVTSNRDGIVPDDAARSALDAWGGPSDELRVGTDEQWYAHADLFIGRDAERDVFEPILAWLDRTPRD